MEDQEKEQLIAEIGRLNEEVAAQRDRYLTLEEENRQLIKVIREVDGLLWDARSLIKDY